MNLLAPLYQCAAALRFRCGRDAGRRGEDLGHLYLRRHGFTVLARNWRQPQGGGELDIVALEGDALVFVEVKFRSSGEWSAPERSIDSEKIAALRRAGRDYARRAGREFSEARFDVLAIVGRRVEHLRDAFSLSI